MKMHPKCLSLVILLGLAMRCPLYASTEDPQSFRIGVIDFFGAGGTDTSALRAKLSMHSGQVILLAQMDASLTAMKSEVLAATGMAVTDVEVLCCDVPDTWDLYVGLPGTSYKPSTHARPPAGDAKLPGDGLALYKQDLNLLMASIQKGHATEDDSRGYQLTNYPPAQKVQLAMRAYALRHTGEIERVLQQSKYAEQRQASATLLGYSERSGGQLAALEAATDDEDSEVRNNAVRALEVMLAAGPIPGLSAKPFVAMLYSGAWSDRNKASLLLDRMTVSRDPALLRQLRDALGPLAEGARWHSPGHARPFLNILGRMGGIEEKRLQALEDADAKDEIIAAARRQ